MATIIHTNPLGWHEGESQMHRLLRVPEYDNPSSFGLSFHATRLLHLSSLLAVGTLDGEGRPWTTLIGGKSGFARSLGSSVVGVKTIVGPKYDPVLERLLSEDGKGKVLSALGIHLDSRDRVKLSGRLLGSGLVDTSDPDNDSSDLRNANATELQMAFAVDQSLGNCPKYLNRKALLPVLPEPTLISTSLPLCSAAVSLLAKADLFFISTSNHASSMGTNHRGGAPGFVRLASNTAQRTTLIYPEYSGNRLYQTLGNLYTTPLAGLVFPDFSTGDVLYVTGTTEITYGREAADLLPRSNLVLKIHLTAARYVQRGLAFRAEADTSNGSNVDKPSPYNPPVRYLPSERADAVAATQTSSTVSATLIAKKLLTPTIARLRFRISDHDRAASASASPAKPRWKAGQYVALAFADELDVGYMHSNDDDPRSLNDDYVRTFTVSSPPPPPPPPPPTSTSTSASASASAGAETEFEITFRNVGAVTSFLYRQHVRSALTVPLQGFAGSFSISPSSDEGKIIPFVAGGIGITPLLAHFSSSTIATGTELELELKRRLRLYWSLSVRDVGLVVDTLERWPWLLDIVVVFLSGGTSSASGDGGSRTEKEEEEDSVARLEKMGAKVVKRRIVPEDLEKDEGSKEAETWYVCAGPGLRKEVLGWLEGRGKNCIWEDFGY